MDSQALLRRKMEQMFSPEDRPEAERIVFEECPKLPMLTHESNLVRVQAAVLKLSGGRLEKLREALAIKDWRDILVWSGFGAGDVWQRWLEE